VSIKEESFSQALHRPGVTMPNIKLILIKRYFVSGFKEFWQFTKLLVVLLREGIFDNFLNKVENTLNISPFPNFISLLIKREGLV
jgi:hypothetical protein